MANTEIGDMRSMRSMRSKRIFQGILILITGVLFIAALGGMLAFAGLSLGGILFVSFLLGLPVGFFAMQWALK